MELENIRILKDMRNTVNRKVNCETANINKTVSAAVKQLEDITYLRDNMGLEKLAEGLREVAYARLSHPDATLKELGELLSPPVGKSQSNFFLVMKKFLLSIVGTGGKPVRQQSLHSGGQQKDQCKKYYGNDESCSSGR